MNSLWLKLLVIFLLLKTVIANACLVDEAIIPIIKQQHFLAKKGMVTERTKRTTVSNNFITVTFQEKQTDDNEPEWQSLHLNNRQQHIRLPDTAPYHLKPTDIIWCRNNFILLPGMSYGGTDHRQWNDTALIKVSKNNIHYLGMINSYLHNDLVLAPNQFAATFAAFDFSPYSGGHIDGITIIVILKEKNGKLIVDDLATYLANLADDELTQSQLMKALEDGSKFQVNTMRCNNSESNEPCEIKNAILHHALKRATLMRYIGKVSELQDITAMLGTSKLINPADIEKFQKFVYEIEPKETSFLFWRKKPEDWFYLKD